MEIQAVKESLELESTAHWSIRSVFLNGINKGTVTVSIDTMYMINRRLEIRQTNRKHRRRKKRKKGIRASKSNEIWHADITILKTLDGKKYYIYFVVDNFSRKVLSYAVRDHISGEVMVKNVEKAFKKAMEVSDNLNVKLIVDGGSENNNIHMDDFISRSEINIEKLVALRDIDYSNSMVEAVNKIAKYQYLFPKHPANLEELLELLAYFVHDYNEVKPHGQLRGLTPSQAYIGIPFSDKRRIEVLSKARQERLAYNKANQCGICKQK
jgi:putative transposase